MTGNGTGPVPPETTRSHTAQSHTARSGDHATALVVPATIAIAGQEWTVRRAWPASRDRIALEVTLGGTIRAGFLGDSGPMMLDVGKDAQLPGLERLLESDGNRLISHRPGKRAVIRLSDGTFAKCVRASRAETILLGQQRAEAFGRGFVLPQILEADDSTVILSQVPGVELHDPRSLGDDWHRAWSQTLEAWSAASTSDAETIPVHSAEAEVRVVEEWHDRARPHLGARLAEVERLTAEVRARLLAGGSRAHSTIHRDLHDKQLMWDPEAGPGLLDVDTACLGERELDLGNLRAHARWRTHQGLWSEADAEVVIREISTITSASGLDPDRVRIYERCALVRLACVYSFRPRWRSHIGSLLEAADTI